MTGLRFGASPLLWNHDHLLDLTSEVPYEVVLDEIAQAGYQGTELGRGFPRDPAVLGPALSARGLALAGVGYVPGLTEGQGVAAALNSVNSLLDFLSALGCSTLIIAEPVAPERAAVAGRVNEVGGRALRDDQWQNLAHGLNELGARCRGRGISLAFHPHVGTYIETPLEVKQLMNMTDSDLVGLCLDTGHYAYGGGDPAEVVATYRWRLRHVQLKDMDLTIKQACTAAGLSFKEALRRHVFCELGTGSVDLAGVAASLLSDGYAGWVVAEQDTSALTPLAAASANRRAMDTLLAKPDR